MTTNEHFEVDRSRETCIINNNNSISIHIYSEYIDIVRHTTYIHTHTHKSRNDLLWGWSAYALCTRICVLYVTQNEPTHLNMQSS